MQINELPQEVLESEFPELVSKNVKRDILLIDNGQKVIISSPDAKGQYHGKVYEFNQPKEKVVFPNMPDFADIPQKVDFLRWDGQTDSTFREDYNNNLIHMQKTINALVDDNQALRKYITDLQTVFNSKQENLIRLISLVVADYIDKNYYQKLEVDAKLNLLEQKIANVQQNATREPPIFYGQNNPSRTSELPPSEENSDIEDKNLRDFINQEGGD